MTQKKKILLFRKSLTTEGGAERFMLEVASKLAERGALASVVVLNGRVDELFGGKYNHVKVHELKKGHYPAGLLGKMARSFSGIFEMRKFIRRMNPDIIMAQNTADAELLFFTTLFTKFKYFLFIPSTIWRFHDDELKYTRRFIKVFDAIHSSVVGHSVFVSKKPPRVGIWKRLLNEIRAWMAYLGVRKARLVLVLTDQMGKEAGLLYNKDYRVIKAGLDKSLFFYEKKKDIKKKLGIQEREMVLDINRLDPRKRIDIAIRAFKILLKTHPDAVFVIGGKGGEKENLEKLIAELGLVNKVKMVGFVPEDELFDFYKSADVFINPCWVDFDLSILEPLALGAKTICSTEVELDESLLRLKDKLLFPGFPSPEGLSATLERAFKSKSRLDAPINEIMSNYTWDSYVDNLLPLIENEIQR